MRQCIKTTAWFAVLALVATLGLAADKPDAPLDEKALGRELGPIMYGKAPEPEVMVALYEKYQHLKTGRLVNTLLMATVSAFTEADRWAEGVDFADRVLADSSFSAEARQWLGLAKAYAQARGGDLPAAERTLDQALALDATAFTDKERDGLVKELQRELAKGKK